MGNEENGVMKDSHVSTFGNWLYDINLDRKFRKRNKNSNTRVDWLRKL